MADQSSALPDVRPIHRLIHRARWLLRSAWGATGVGLTIGIALTLLITLVLLDLTRPLSTTFRWLGLAILLLPTMWVFLVTVLLPLLRGLGAVEMARRIEAKIPGMHSRLVSCVDLSAESAQKTSPAFYRRLVSEAIERIRDFHPLRIVDRSHLRRALGFGLMAIALFAGLYLALTTRVGTAVARILNPAADIPPSAAVAYDIEPGTTKVLKGDDVTFQASFTRGEPCPLTLELYGNDDTVLRFDLETTQDPKTLRIVRNTTNLGIGFDQSFQYRIVGGGTWSTLQQVTLLERPSITSIQTAVYHPAYMGIPEPRLYPPQITDVTGPEKGEVEVLVEAEGNVAQAEIQILQQRTTRTEFGPREQRIWLDTQTPPGATADGAWLWQRNQFGRPVVHQTNAFVPGVPPQGPLSHTFSNSPTPMLIAPGESLFAFVYIEPSHPPQTIMLQWQDNSGSWEHRAYWGEDRIPYGNAGTVGHHAIGPIPSEWRGQWVRLEVPARLVGLEGKDVRGMSFAHFGGHVVWAEAGIGQPTFDLRTELAVVATHPMIAVDETMKQFRGRFPLNGSGLYRVELRNELGHANKPMKEAKYEATPDQAPEIFLERPAVDLTLSKPEIVPLQAAVRDDYGLAEVWLAIQREGDLRYTRIKAVKQYPTPNPMRNDALIYPMDLAQFGVKVGDTIRYRLEVLDRRPNRESSKSKDYLIRVLPDPNALDKQRDNFEKAQDAFREKLVKLIGDQAKIRDQIDTTVREHQKLEDKIRAIQTADAAMPPTAPKQPNAPKTDPTQQPLTPAQMQQLSPDEQRELQELRKQLGALAAEETKNAQLAQQMQNELNQIAEQAGKLSVLPQEISAEMNALREMFQRQANQPLQDLANRLQQQANPQQAPPDLKGVDRQSDRVQNALEAMQRRLKALADAQRELKEGDPRKALNNLQNEMLRERGRMSQDELQNLKDYIEQLRGDLEKLQNRQENLANETANSEAKNLPMQEQKQLALDELLDPKLREAKNLLDDPKTERLRKPMFPDKPFEADPDRERTLPPNEDDTEPMPKDADPADPTMSPNPKKKPMPMNDEDKEPTFQPALNGEKIKPDPRFADKQRPKEPKPKRNTPPTAEEQRQELQERQEQNLEQLDSAQRSLAADQRAIERMMQQMQRQNQQAQKSPMNDPQPSSPAEMQQALEQLQQSLQSPQMQQAMRMAQRAQQPARGQQGQQANQPPSPMMQPIGNLQGNRPRASTDADLSQFDLQTRAILLQMRPQLREELLQGMKDEGPEGYRKFIADYFKRLSEAK